MPPLGTKAQYVRLVAELPRGVLSIAEVEVFTGQSHVLSQYAGGTPVRTAYHPGGSTPRSTATWDGLDETERDHLDIDGNGLLDSIEADTYLRRYSPNGYTELSSNNWERELKEFMLSYQEYGAVQVLRDLSERQLRLPSSVCSAECLAAIKLDPYYYVGLDGDRALKLLRVVGDRIVKYVPDAGFRGLDAFTFSVAVTGQESLVLGTIQLAVKECEDPECRMSIFLLHRKMR
ncbi:hypothetical protein PInf_000730 [Phytophthora infestans]|nr:hypothetical protein PInf_000730 [Phytophthora infestans]